MKFVCLILEPVVLIADDLSMMIKEAMPGATLVAVATAQEALDALARLGSVNVALVAAPPAPFTAGPLGRALAAANTAVVFLGYEAEARAAGHRFLEQPFLRESVATVFAEARLLASAAQLSGAEQGLSVDAMINPLEIGREAT